MAPILKYIRSRAEKPLLALLLAVGYLLTTFYPGREVFLGEFNSVDGSIYAARTIDAMLAFVAVWVIGLRCLPTYLQRRHLSSFLLRSAGLILVLVVTDHLLDQITLVAYNLPTGPGQVSDKMMIHPRRLAYEASAIGSVGLAYAIALAYGLARSWFVSAQTAKLLIREKMQADIDLLRSQINPHFFFNSMNNILAITQRNNDEEAGRAITKLSGVMRYMIYDSDSESIDLAGEIDHIEAYLEVAKLKFAKDDPVEFRITRTGRFPGIRIAPLLLVPFVENAVKHGVNSSGQGFVSIKVEVSDRRLRFSVVNSTHPEKTEFCKHSGIGLANVRKRLELLYSERHELRLVETESTYSALLTLDLEG